MLDLYNGLAVLLIFGAIWILRRHKRLLQYYPTHKSQVELTIELMFDGYVEGILGAIICTSVGYLVIVSYLPYLMSPNLTKNLAIAFLIGWFAGGTIAGMIGYVLVIKNNLMLRRYFVAYLGFLCAIIVMVGYSIFYIYSNNIF